MWALFRRLDRSGKVDFARDFAPSHVPTLDAGAPITILAGLHLGCFEVIAKKDIRDYRRPEGQDCRCATCG